VSRLTAIELPEPRTRLYPLIQQRVAGAARPLDERLQAWRMMNAQGLRTTKFHGEPVSYQGVTFDGTPRVVFWGDFFEPFMYEAARQSLESVIELCHERQLDPGEYVSEATSLLDVLITQAYEDMARTDQVLRGHGYPNSVGRMTVTNKVEAMKKRVADLVVALTHRGGAKPSASEKPSAPEILQLKLTFWGMSVGLKALWRRWFSRWFKRVR